MVSLLQPDSRFQIILKTDEIFEQFIKNWTCSLFVNLTSSDQEKNYNLKNGVHIFLTKRKK